MKFIKFINIDIKDIIQGKVNKNNIVISNIYYNKRNIKILKKIKNMCL
jgi:hypothetical protein